VLFDLASVTGGILAGYLSDKVFKGNRGIVGVLFLLALMSVIVLLIYAPSGLVWLDCLLMGLIGFFISGPQILAGVAAADFASKRVAGTANGLIGIFGYLGASIAGFGVAKMSDILGWNATLLGFAGAAVFSAVFFGMTFAVLDREKKVKEVVVAEALG
jgi:sugar phosphate permease